MLNTYTLEVYKKQNQPCVVVNITHTMLTGVYFFRSVKDANAFIANKKEVLGVFAPLTYDPNGVTEKGAMNVIQTVLNDDNICIAENGKTFAIMV